jgi:hypothetical protein
MPHEPDNRIVLPNECYWRKEKAFVIFRIFSKHIHDPTKQPGQLTFLTKDKRYFPHQHLLVQNYHNNISALGLEFLNI